MNDPVIQSKARLISTLINAVDAHYSPEVIETFYILKQRNLHNRYALLHFAIRELKPDATEEAYDIIKFFLQAGCDPNWQDWNEIVPLQHAGFVSNALFNLLIGYKANPSGIERDPVKLRHSTLLQSAEHEARLVSDIVQAVDNIDRKGTEVALLKLKDKNVHNDHDLLDVAIDSGQIFIVKFFLEMGCDPCQRNWNGELPLQNFLVLSSLRQLKLKYKAESECISTENENTALSHTSHALQ